MNTTETLLAFLESDALPPELATAFAQVDRVCARPWIKKTTSNDRAVELCHALRSLLSRKTSLSQNDLQRLLSPCNWADVGILEPASSPRARLLAAEHEALGRAIERASVHSPASWVVQDHWDEVSELTRDVGLADEIVKKMQRSNERAERICTDLGALFVEG